eukprot:ctg_348.g257
MSRNWGRLPRRRLRSGFAGVGGGQTSETLMAFILLPPRWWAVVTGNGLTLAARSPPGLPGSPHPPSTFAGLHGGTAHRPPTARHPSQRRARPRLPPEFPDGGSRQAHPALPPLYLGQGGASGCGPHVPVRRLFRGLLRRRAYTTRKTGAGADRQRGRQGDRSGADGRRAGGLAGSVLCGVAGARLRSGGGGASGRGGWRSTPH